MSRHVPRGLTHGRRRESRRPLADRPHPVRYRPPPAPVRAGRSSRWRSSAGFADARESSVVSLAAVVVFIVVQLFTLAHDDRLCLRCLAESPTDPARAVETRRRWLRMFHSATTTAGVAVLVVDRGDRRRGRD